MNAENQQPAPLAKQPLSLVLTEEQWLLIGCALSRIMKGFKS
jgi:hypothetical protein